MLEQELFLIDMCKLSNEAVKAILKQGKIYEVGGTVRDRYLDEQILSKDRDYLVAGIPFNELKKILKKFGQVNLVGQSFGVIKFTQSLSGNLNTFDITLPRKEYSTGIGHKDFEVAFDPYLNIDEDLHRRDFTINAMAVELESDELIDPHDGMIDLKNKFIRIVYKNSFEDDPLRMLRAVQFAARFNFMIEPETFKSMRKNANLINTVSPERIAEELNKLLLLAKKPSEGFRLMQTSGILKEMIPELEECVGIEQPGGYHKYDVFEHTLQIIDNCPPILRLRMAALFHDINKPQAKRIVDDGATFYGHEAMASKTAKNIMSRLRYPNDFIKQVQTLVERHMFTVEVTDKGLRRLVRKTSVELIFELLDLRRADVIAQGMGSTTEDVDFFEKRIREELDKQPPFGLNDLVINGSRIMELLQIEECPLIGEVLNHLMEKVLDNPEDNKTEILEKYVEEFIQNKKG